MWLFEYKSTEWNYQYRHTVGVIWNKQTKKKQPVYIYIYIWEGSEEVGLDSDI